MCGGPLEMQRTPERIVEPAERLRHVQVRRGVGGDQPRPPLRDPDGRAALQHRAGPAAVGLQRLLGRLPDLLPALPARRRAHAVRGRPGDPRLRQHPRRRRRERPRADRRPRRGRVFNVGGGTPYTTAEFADIVRQHYGSELPARITGEYRFGDTRHILSDIDALKRSAGRRSARRRTRSPSTPPGCSGMPGLDEVLADGRREDAVAGRRPKAGRQA